MKKNIGQWRLFIPQLTAEYMVAMLYGAILTLLVQHLSEPSNKAECYEKAAQNARSDKAMNVLKRVCDDRFL